jgi:uncharacterized phosphosugar-binding protein
VENNTTTLIVHAFTSGHPAGLIGHMVIDSDGEADVIGIPGKVVSIISRLHSEKSVSKRSDGKRLGDFSDLVLDTGAPVGDAMVYVPGLDTPVSPGSTLGGTLLINCIKAELAALLTAAGQPPKVLSGAVIVGEERAVSLFESAYDEHAHRLAKLFENVGNANISRP